MACEHDCPRPPPFPRPIRNRPGLDEIDYRIGAYDAMRAHIFAALDAAPDLAAWTHRLPDDPGIALCEGAALVGDILAQYQHRYANEALLRTARWRDSVAELLRVLGYRLAPGLGGRARFALGVSGDRPVQVPAGFAFTATLPGAPEPATFETSRALEARPALSRFHLYRPRRVPSIVNDMDTFTLEASADLSLAKGDRLMVGIASAGDGRTLTHTQVLVVDKTWEAFGLRYVKTQGRIACLQPRLAPGRVSLGASLGLRPEVAALGSAGASPASLSSGISLGPFGSVVGPALRSGLLGSGLAHLPAFSNVLAAGLGVALLGAAPSLRAFKIGASARHFGHNAPATRVAIDGNGRASEVAVPYVRRLDANQGAPAAPQLRPLQLPLDGEVPEFHAGTSVLVEANLSASATGTSGRKRILERSLAQVDRQSLGWGGMTGASTVLSLDEDLALAEPGAALRYADVRGVTVHAVLGEGFTLRAAPRPTPEATGTGLDFFGGADDAQALLHRTLLLMLPAKATGGTAVPEANPATAATTAGGVGTVLAVRVTQVTLAGAADPLALHRLTLDQSVPLSAFDHDTPTVPVHGNLVDATQGKTEAERALGNGDARARFQTFLLPKAPLTWLLTPDTSPPRSPELEVWVAGQRWHRVESLFGLGPRERVYVVREDTEGRSWVQFGDGRSGARLPTGVGNVVARWRSGNGARGLASEPPAPAGRLPGFDQAWMLEPATEGAPPEAADHAREAAPAWMQGLGRIVSLADCEAEALQVPGVLKARARWAVMEGTPRVVMTVLTASAQAADQQAIDRALRRALAARGPARFALQVRMGRVQPLRVTLAVQADPDLRQEDVADAVAQALGADGFGPQGELSTELDAARRGLLHWRSRQFGQGVHGSQVAGVAQNVPGVRWVRLDLLAPVASPLVARSTAGALRRSLAAGPDQLFVLPRARLTLRFVGDDTEAPTP